MIVAIVTVLLYYVLVIQYLGEERPAEDKGKDLHLYDWVLPNAPHFKQKMVNFSNKCTFCS